LANLDAAHTMTVDPSNMKMQSFPIDVFDFDKTSPMKLDRGFALPFVIQQRKSAIFIAAKLNDY